MRAWVSADSRSHSATFFPALPDADSISANSASVSRVATDLVRLLSLVGAKGDAAETAACGLSSGEAIGRYLDSGILRLFSFEALFSGEANKLLLKSVFTRSTSRSRTQRCRVYVRKRETLNH
jgi:hypothetical protein